MHDCPPQGSNMSRFFIFKNHRASGAYSAEEVESVIQTFDLGIVSAGFSDGFSAKGDGDAIVIKTDINGQLRWAKTYGDTTDNMAVDIKETPDTGLIFAGWTTTEGNYDFWIVKLDSSGNIQWERRFGVQEMNKPGLWMSLLMAILLLEEQILSVQVSQMSGY